MPRLVPWVTSGGAFKLLFLHPSKTDHRADSGDSEVEIMYVKCLADCLTFSVHSVNKS